MKLRAILIASLLTLAFTSSAAAQDSPSRTDSTANFRQQLIELETKEAQLRMRLEELDEALKPENIERALAGIGSTRPEELREHRRRMLTIEKNGLQAQLKLIEESRIRTESAIATAEAESYLKYAQPSPRPSMLMVMAPNIQNSRSFLRTILLVAAVLIVVVGVLTSLFAGRRIA